MFSPKKIRTLDDYITNYMQVFLNQKKCWTKQWVSKDKSHHGYSYQTPEMDTKGGWLHYEPLSAELIKQHLNGKITIGIPAIDEHFHSRWLCFDSDVNNGVLDSLETKLRRWGLHTMREGRRPGRDGHLWVLFDAPIETSSMIILGDAMMKHAGVSDLERFPKSATGLSQVRAPLGINRKPEANGARGWFEGVEQNVLSQLQWLSEQPLNSAIDALREANLHKPSQKLEIFSGQKKRSLHIQSFNILDHVKTTKRVGKMFAAQCPLCAQEGHDVHQDNLRVSIDGQLFCCVFGGPAQIHKCAEITALIKKRKVQIVSKQSI